MKKPIDLILLSIILAVIGQVLLKKGMNEIGEIGSGNISYYLSILSKSLLNARVILGLILYFVSALLWLVVLSRTELSFAFPFVSISYILVMIVAWLFLHEQVNSSRFLGSLITVLGIILISRS